MPGEPAGRGHPAGEHGGQQRLVELHHRLRLGQPAPHLHDQLGDPLGQGLPELTPGAVVRQHPVAAWALHGRGQRPRPGDGVLDRAGVALGLLLQLVQVGPQRADRQPVLTTGPVGQPPAGRLQIDRQPGEQGGRPTDQPRVRAPGRQLGQVGQIRALGEGDLDRVADVGRRARSRCRWTGPATRSVTSRGGRGDGRAADDPGGVVEHDGLSGRDPRRRRGQHHLEAVAVDVRGGRQGASVGAQLGQAGPGPVIGPCGPGRPDGADGLYARAPRAARR